MTESLHLVIYSLTLAGGAIFWCSRKQNSVALSSMEAEYITASEAAKEGMWLREFLACHTRFMKANRMHLICAPGSVYTHMIDHKVNITTSASVKRVLNNFITKPNVLSE